MSRAKTFVGIYGEPFFEIDFVGIFDSHVKERYKERVFKRYDQDNLPDPGDRLEAVYRHYAKSMGEDWEYIARLARIKGAEPTAAILDDMGLCTEKCYFLKR